MPGAMPPAGGQPKSERSVPLLVAILGGAGLFLVSCLGGVGIGAAGSGTTKAAPAPQASTVTKTVQRPAPAGSTVTVTVTVKPKPPEPANKIEDGSWTVGEDFPAGVYKVTGAGDLCYWAIYKPGANVGGFDGIVENHNGGGNLKVTLKQGYGVESERCGTWAKVG
jgi:hypothetical protein